MLYHISYLLQTLSMTNQIYHKNLCFLLICDCDHPWQTQCEVAILCLFKFLKKLKYPQNYLKKIMACEDCSMNRQSKFKVSSRKSFFLFYWILIALLIYIHEYALATLHWVYFEWSVGHISLLDCVSKTCSGDLWQVLG